MALTIIYALIGFIILVFFHEFGHFIFAKLGKVGVEEFSIGMGRAIAKKRYKGTLYKIGWIPFGGYCKLKGQDDFGPVVVTEEKDNFFAKPPYIRFLVSLGGPLFSYILGVVLLMMGLLAQGDLKINYTKISVSPNHTVLKEGDEILAVNGEKVKTLEEVQMLLINQNKKEIKLSVNREGKIVELNYIPDIEKMAVDPDFMHYGNSSPALNFVKEDSPAAKAGLQKGDEIISLNGHPILNELALKHAIQNSSLPLIFKIKRNNQEISKEVTPTNQNGKNFVGISFVVKRDLSQYTEKVEYSIPQAFGNAANTSLNVITLSYKGIVYLVSGDVNFKDNVAGPVKIFTTMGEAGSKGGFFAFLSFAAFISIALAFFNFLPFPALDGGHMVFSIYEMIFRRRVSPKVASALQIFGIVILLGLMLFVTVNDVVKMIG